MKFKNRKILIIIIVCLFIGGLLLVKKTVNNKVNTAEKEQETATSSVSMESENTEEPTTTEQQQEGPLYINWVNNVQSAKKEFVVGAEVELEISCNKEVEISWHVTEGDLLGKLTSNKVWWRLPDKEGKYTVTVTVQEGAESKFLSRTVKVNPYTTGRDPFADITALNGGVTPIVSYDSKTGIPSMIIGRYSPKKIYTAEDAIDSLNDIKTIMNIENPREEFELLKTECVDNMPSYILKQVYKGVPVNGGHIVIEVSSNYDVFSINGSYYPQVRLSGISIEPAIDESQASAIAEEDLANTDMRNFIHRLIEPRTYELSSAILVIDMVYFKEPELVWEISANANADIWEYSIHAQTGEIIDKYSRGLYGIQ